MAGAGPLELAQVGIGERRHLSKLTQRQAGELTPIADEGAQALRLPVPGLGPGPGHCRSVILCFLLSAQDGKQVCGEPFRQPGPPGITVARQPRETRFVIPTATDALAEAQQAAETAAAQAAATEGA